METLYRKYNLKVSVCTLALWPVQHYLVMTRITQTNKRPLRNIFLSLEITVGGGAYNVSGS